MISMARLSLNKNATARLGNRLSRKALCLTAVAAFSTTTSSTVGAFVSHPVLQQPRPLSSILVPRQTVRMYSSSKKNENFLKKIGTKLGIIKQSEEEERKELARQQVKDNVSGGIKALLKDAPLPVKMFGSVLAPLLSKAASSMSESIAEQENAIERVLDDSRGYILGDDVALRALGGAPVQVGAPFSQSSSTMVVNGQKKVNIALSFPVEGSSRSGIAQAQATDRGINRLTLEVDGQQINVSLTKQSSPSRSASRIGKNHFDDDDDIIEAEVIEKVTKK